MDRNKLRASLEAAYDILYDLEHIIITAQWVAENYHDNDVLPWPKSGDRYVQLRSEMLDALLMRYRRCFYHDRRGTLATDLIDAGFGHRIDHHRYMLKRANEVVAHAIDPSSSCTVSFDANSEPLFSVQRPGFNKSDFEGLISLSNIAKRFFGKWLAELIALARSAGFVFENNAYVVDMRPFSGSADIQKAHISG